jgi:hypothetical protein
MESKDPMKTDRVKHLAVSAQPRELDEIYFFMIYLYAILTILLILSLCINLEILYIFI